MQRPFPIREEDHGLAPLRIAVDHLIGQPQEQRHFAHQQLRTHAFVLRRGATRAPSSASLRRSHRRPFAQTARSYTPPPPPPSSSCSPSRPCRDAGSPVSAVGCRLPPPAAAPCAPGAPPCNRPSPPRAVLRRRRPEPEDGLETPRHRW